MFNNAVSHLEIGDIAGHLTWLSEIVEIGDKKDEMVIQAIARLDEMDDVIRESHGIDLHSYIKNAKDLNLHKKRWKYANGTKPLISLKVY